MATSTALDAVGFARNVMARNPHITVVLEPSSDGHVVWHVTQRLDNPASPSLVTEYRRVASEPGIDHVVFHARFWGEMLRTGVRFTFPRA